MYVVKIDGPGETRARVLTDTGCLGRDEGALFTCEAAEGASKRR